MAREYVLLKIGQIGDDEQKMDKIVKVMNALSEKGFLLDSFQSHVKPNGLGIVFVALMSKEKEVSDVEDGGGEGGV